MHSFNFRYNVFIKKYTSNITLPPYWYHITTHHAVNSKMIKFWISTTLRKEKLTEPRVCEAKSQWVISSNGWHGQPRKARDLERCESWSTWSIKRWAVVNTRVDQRSGFISFSLQNLEIFHSTRRPKQRLVCSLFFLLLSSCKENVFGSFLTGLNIS